MFVPQASGFGGESFSLHEKCFQLDEFFRMLSYLLRMSIFSLATFFTTLFMVNEKSFAVRFRKQALRRYQ